MDLIDTQMKASANAIVATVAVANAALPKAGGTMTGDVTFADNIYAKFGTGNDLRIRHDGSNSYIAEMGTGNLIVQTNGADFLVENTDGDNMINAISDGAVELSHNNAVKIATAATGVAVTGSITNAKNVAKVWIKFDGGGGTIDASYNVSSLGDWGTGNYGVYIATDINTNYSAMVGTTQAQIGSVQLNNTQPNGGRCDVRVDTHSGSAVDPQHVFVTIHGEDT
jgi:hypothetical protein